MVDPESYNGSINGLPKNKPTTSKTMGFIKTHRWVIFFWLRELIWMIGRWKSKDLDKFIDIFNPDLIFLPLYYQHYPNDIGLYVQQRTGKKMVLYVSDDNYSLRQYSLSPLYWIDRFIKRRKIRRVVRKSELMYTISRIQQIEYEKQLGIPCKILFKCGNFSGEAPIKEFVTDPVKMVFTGNIGSGRWESLAAIGDALRSLNRNGVKAFLEIYTMTPITSRMRKRLDDGESILFRGSLAADQVSIIQKAADILVHVESFKKKQFLTTRQSFSTKIVDYLQRARCILAVGSGECASIDYFKQNNAGVVATSPALIVEKISELLNHPRLIKEYGIKAFLCGHRHHQSERIKNMLRDDLMNIAGIIRGN